MQCFPLNEIQIVTAWVTVVGCTYIYLEIRHRMNGK
jgi:hypothetical protein